MFNLEPMVTAVTFIEDCLQENIKVADMADAVNFSLFHFCRTFNKIVHHTPYDYLIRRRLSESARLLLETDCPYLAPVPQRGRRNEPALINLTAQRIADIRAVSLEELGRQTNENFRRIFSISA